MGADLGQQPAPSPIPPQMNEPSGFDMGNDPMSDDVNGGDNPVGDNDEANAPDSNGVDNKAQKAAGELSYILPDASEETVDYVMGMLAPAVGKNDNVGDDNVEKWSEKMKSGDDKKSDEDENNDNENEETPEGDNEDMAMESINYIDNLISETLQEYFNVNDKRENTRPEKKLDKTYIGDENPFSSPF